MTNLSSLRPSFSFVATGGISRHCPQNSIMSSILLDHSNIHPIGSFIYFRLFNHNNLVRLAVEAFRFHNFLRSHPHPYQLTAMMSGQVRYGGIRRSSASPRPPCDGVPSASVWPSPRQTPAPSCPHPSYRTPDATMKRVGAPSE